nr:PREDICTED: synaptonemal complex central element protein 1-like [Camelus bactrianus]
MAGRLELLEVEPPEVASEAEGQTKSSKKTEDLLEMVKKLQKEGSLEPQIEDLINRINELQQAKKKSSEELGEAQALWEALHRELDSLNEEKVHLEEILSKKQEALRTLQLHCQRTERESQRLPVEEQLEDLIGQHKDLWEFHMLKQRLAWEISALQGSLEQLLTEGLEGMCYTPAARSAGVLRFRAKSQPRRIPASPADTRRPARAPGLASHTLARSVLAAQLLSTFLQALCHLRACCVLIEGAFSQVSSDCRTVKCQLLGGRPGGPSFKGHLAPGCCHLLSACRLNKHLLSVCCVPSTIVGRGF